MLVEQIGRLTVQIRGLERRIEAPCETEYPETRLLGRVSGGGGSRRWPAC